MKPKPNPGEARTDFLGEERGSAAVFHIRMVGWDVLWLLFGQNLDFMTLGAFSSFNDPMI